MIVSVDLHIFIREISDRIINANLIDNLILIEYA